MPNSNIIKPVYDKDRNELSDQEIQKRINELRVLVEEDEELQVRTDDNWLLRFLYATHFEVEEAYKRMRVYYKLKEDYPDFFYTEPPSKMKHVIDLNFKIMLDGRDRDGRRIFLHKLGDIPSSVSLYDFIYVDDLWLEAILDEPETQRSGLACIIDMANAPWRLLKWLTPHNCKVGSRKADTIPIVDITYHIVNSSGILNVAIAIVFPFLSAKIKERIHFHYSNWESLHKYVSPDILPIEYGGKLAEIEYEKIKKQFLYDQSDSIVRNLNASFKTKK